MPVKASDRSRYIHARTYAKAPKPNAIGEAAKVDEGAPNGRHKVYNIRPTNQ